MDSQTVKTGSVSGEQHGFDTGKKIKGRKRRILVDTLGFLLAVIVTLASIQDRDGAKWLLKPLDGSSKKLRKIWVDGGYRGMLLEWVKLNFRFILEVVLRNDEMNGFVILPKRWIVERTFAWLLNYRRLVNDYERYCQTSETFIYIAMTRFLVQDKRP